MEDIYIIKFRNNEEKLDSYPSECLTRINKRKKFIKILEENEFNWKDANKLSKIWYNINYNKSKYSQDIYNIIMKFNKLLEETNSF